ncbi:MAG: mechanosensitive ion channel [Candidatus Brocadiaceae bacterium]|nr:mechanosensitive ion channel [Candidatus Brocadiaceae bacterium]
MLKKTVDLFVLHAICIVTITMFQVGVQGSTNDNSYQESSTFTPDQISILLEDTKGRLNDIPEDVHEDSMDGKLRYHLNKRTVVINELLSVLEQDETLFSVSSNITQKIEDKEKELAALSYIHNFTPPDQPTQEELDELIEKAKEMRNGILETKDEIRLHAKFIKSASDTKDKAEKRKQEALNRINSLKNQISSRTDIGKKELLQIQLITGEIEFQIGTETLSSLKSKLDRIEKVHPLLTVEQQIKEKSLEALANEIRSYRKCYAKELKTQHKKTEMVLAQKVALVVDAKDPKEKLIAEWEAKLALSQKNKSSLEADIVNLQSIFDEQDSVLHTEKDKLEYFTSRLSRLGAASIPAELIKRELQRLKAHKKGLKHALPVDYTKTVEFYEAREFEIDDELRNFSEIWDKALTLSSKTLNDPGNGDFEEKILRIANEYKSSLQAESNIISRYFELDQNTQRHLLERAEVLEEIERIVWSSRFWIQDGKPMDLKLFKKLMQEMVVVGNQIKNFDYAKVLNTLILESETINTILRGLLLFIILPVMLFLFRLRLARIVTKYNKKTLRSGHRWQNKMAAVIGGIASSITFPIYLFLFSEIIGSAEFSENVNYVFKLVFFHSGIFLLLFLLNRSFFHKRGIAPVQFGLNKESSRIIYRSLQIVIISSVTLRMMITVTETLLVMPATAEMLLFVELVIQGVVMWWVLRSKSKLIKNEIMTSDSSFLASYWPMISYAIFSLILATWILAVTGYSYAAAQFSRSLLESIVVVFLLPQIYKLVVQLIENIAQKRRRLIWLQTHNREEEKDKKEEEIRLTDQTKSFVRVFFYIIGVLVILNIWGLDEGAFKTFDEIGVYKITTASNENEMISVGDLLMLTIVVLSTVWILKNLTGIVKFTIFSRLKLDDGLRYAILTITRYSIFLIAALLVLSTIHLDLGRIGWLVAAMGVGLGFGLQEIVLNFVSGIILLIERPIRVDDVVTIGNNIGTVTHINIRATTIINFDRQELIVPNRMLITQEVTNWTHGDSIIRLIVPIGVAYGSDTDKVSELLLNIAKEESMVLDDPAPCVHFMSHGESSLDFEMRVFLPNPMLRFETLDSINKSINRKLAENGIEIPFPQRDIHIKRVKTT